MAFLKNIPATHDDAELIRRYKNTRELADLGALYQRYMELVYGVCLKYVQDPDDAKDCVLNIFEELVSKVQKHEIAHFRSWLYQLSKNHCLMRLRSAKKTRIISMDAPGVQLENNLHLDGVFEREEQFEQLASCLAQLPDEQRKIVSLFYQQGKCYNEIAASTGLEWNKVRSAIQNGRRNLKMCMEKKIRSTF